MNVSQINFESIRESYAPIFAALERGFTYFDIDFYLIGAQSRDVWINHLSLVKRTTTDIDFAILINKRDQWNELIDYLIQKEHFTRDAKLPYRFYLDGNMLDLIPFGGMEENGEVILENPQTELSVYGCREVTEDAVVIFAKYKVVTLPGLCIMKLIAFDEKPDSRPKDYEDFIFVLKNYGEIAGEQLYSGDYDDLINAAFEPSIAAARMLGRHMEPTLRKNEGLQSRIVSILERKLKGFTPEEIDQMYTVNEKDDQIVLQLKLIREVLQGIVD